MPLLKNSESKHILISGSSGTGKTVAMLELLDQIRANKQRAIVYDKMGIYLKHFYRPETDVILNPLDSRSPAWNVFSEGRYPSDYDPIAAALMPMHHHASDPFWVNGARTIFSCLAVKLHQENRKDNQNFLKLMLNNDLEGLGKVLKGTPAETLVSEKSDKTAFSVLSVLATYVRSLLYLPQTGDDFSIRKWVEDDKADSFLFVASRADQHETLKPLISGWLEIATNALLSLEPNPTRRIWTILDELPSLHRLPSLPSALAESRQFGGCMVLSIQSIAQLRDIYGKDGAEALSSLCNTRLFFRTPDPVTAEWVSQALGQIEVDENKEGLSYGAHESRDGVSMHSQTFLRPVVLPSEILALEDLNAYLRLPGQWPITKVKLTPCARKSEIKAFVPRTPSSAPDPKQVEIGQAGFLPI